MKLSQSLALASLTVALGATLQNASLPATAAPLLHQTGSATVAAAPSFFALTVQSLDGANVPLTTYRGKVLLVVNTASKCGFTPQYEGLEKLYTDYASKGFFVLGFPSNDFGGQEPGSSTDIRQFCTSKYHVTFPMFSKVVVKAGPQQSDIYKLLAGSGQTPRWNFGKYLIGRDGRIIQFFDSAVKPDAPELQQAIQKALAEKG